MLASVYPQNDNPNRVSKYKKYLETLNTKGIEMPMAVMDIDKFEKQNNYVIMFMDVIKMAKTYFQEESVKEEIRNLSISSCLRMVNTITMC